MDPQSSNHTGNGPVNGERDDRSFSGPPVIRPHVCCLEAGGPGTLRSDKVVPILQDDTGSAEELLGKDRQ